MRLIDECGVVSPGAKLRDLLFDDGGDALVESAIECAKDVCAADRARGKVRKLGLAPLLEAGAADVVTAWLELECGMVVLEADWALVCAHGGVDLSGMRME